MFNRAIEQISPWSDRGMFNKIHAPTFVYDGYCDNTMFITATALMERRLKEEFYIYLATMSEYSAIEDVKNCVEGFGLINEPDGGEFKNRLVIVEFNREETDIVDRFMKDLDDHFIESFPFMKPIDKTTKFLNGYFSCRVFINDENRSAIIFTGNLSMSKWHLLQSVIPTYLPDVFREIGLEENEKLMLHALTGRNVAGYQKYLSELEDYYHIREKKIESLIGDFQKRDRQRRLSEIDQKIQEIIRRQQALMADYRQTIEDMDEQNIRRNGLAYAINNTNDKTDELIGFLQSQKNIDLVSVHNTTLSFVVRTTYDNFDEDCYEDFRENPRFWDELKIGGVFSDTENCKTLMDAIFIDRKIKVMLCGFFALDTRRGVDSMRGYDFPVSCVDYMPNYHLDNYDCLGSYASVINDYVNRGDVVGAIGACVESCKAINIHENATFNPFVKKLFGTNKKCIQLPDGRNVCPADALKYLKEEDAE